jgi:hypothetical protein
VLSDFSDITLLLGVDAQHLEELRWVWPTWLAFKAEILKMSVVIFYDPDEVSPDVATFLSEHRNVRWVPWRMPAAHTHREAMITGWIHIAAREVRTKWYLKLDTDAVATRRENWLQKKWFARDARGREPVFIGSKWNYSKPRYIIDLLDDWADHVPSLAGFSRLDLPYTSASGHVSHPRIISWFFIGRTDWTRLAASWLGKDGRLPYPSQDTYLFYCAKRRGEYFVRAPMTPYGWVHSTLRLKDLVQGLGMAPAEAEGLPRKKAVGTKRGVLYYNTGTACAVRLLVALVSLRRHYDGPVTILSEGEASHEKCRAIAAATGAEFKEWNCEVPEGPNRVYLAKTRYFAGTPYETTVALDSDTLVVGGIEELFEQAEEASFCVSQLADWRSSGSTIAARIRGWAPWLPADIELALHFGPAINCGVVSFRKDATIFEDWLRLALPGRRNFIPDESCCQVILHRYPHRILDGRWNRSCKHDNPDDAETRIIHYHGAKHCRPGLPFHGNRWVAAWEQVRKANLANIRRWAPAGDRMLRLHLRTKKEDERRARETGGAQAGGNTR